MPCKKIWPAKYFTFHTDKCDDNCGKADTSGIETDICVWLSSYTRTEWAKNTENKERLVMFSQPKRIPFGGVCRKGAGSLQTISVVLSSLLSLLKAPLLKYWVAVVFHFQFYSFIYIYILRSFYIDINEEQNAAKNISSQLQGKWRGRGIIIIIIIFLQNYISCAFRFFLIAWFVACYIVWSMRTRWFRYARPTRQRRRH